MRGLAAPLLLILAATGIFAAILGAQRARATAALRTACLETAVTLGVLVVASVEMLSWVRALRAPELALFWAAVATGGWGVAIARRRGGADGASLAALLGARARALRSLPRPLGLMLVTAGCMLGLALVIAVVSPTNSWDSMAYHMPRVAHWLADASVHHYRTINLQQLLMPPFNAYAIATLQSLAATDRWANVVQWLAYAGGALAVSLATERIGGSRRAQVTAALVFLTIPMAVAQAATTQADLLSTFWVLAVLVFVAGAEDSPARWLWAGASFGLAALTKPIAPLLCLPLVLMTMARALRRTPADRIIPWKSGAAVAAAFGLTALVLLAPQASRNTQTFGNPIGLSRDPMVTNNEAIGLRSWASNLLRETALHLPLPGYASAVASAHRVLGIDPDDERTTLWQDGTFSTATRHWFRPLNPSEESVGSPLHLVAGLVFLGIGLWRRSSLPPAARAAMAIGTVALAGWLLILMPLKWQMWGSRFDLPFFALLSVPLGVAIAGLRGRCAWLLPAGFVLGALPALLISVRRPLLPLGAWTGARMQRDYPASILTADRDHLRFAAWPELEAPYRAAAELVRASGCHDVGLELTRNVGPKSNDWEYPLWALLGAANGNGSVRIATVAVANESAALAPEVPEFCLVISAASRSAFDDAGAWTAHRISSDPLVTVYERRASAS